MKRYAAALLLCTASLSGCFTSSVVLTVRPDGSGTVEQRVAINPAAMIEFQKLASPGLAANAADAAALIQSVQHDLDKAVAGARFQSGARLRSALPVNTDHQMGWTLTYDFDDVTALDVDLVPQMPGVGVSYGVPIAPKDKGNGASTRVKATLEPTAGGFERLTFHLPRFALDTTAEPPAAWASGSPAEMTALKKLMAGSRITIAVNSAAPIVRTNSPFREDHRVVLLDAEVDQALFSKQIGMMATTPATFQELLNAFADLPGVRFSHDSDIWIEFENPSTRPSPGIPPSSTSSTDTEIFVASLAETNGDLAVGAPINITNSPGYDNQPSFSPDGREILFASARGAEARGDGSGTPPTDIYRYEIATRRLWRVTNTPESEFSPGLMPDAENISIVRVEADSTQRLWRVANNNSGKGKTAVVLPDLKPIGYYAWMDDRTVAIFVLGEGGQPATLQVADIVTGRSQVVASNIGRSIQRMPSGAISFVQRDGPSDRPRLTIARLSRSDSGEFRIEQLIQPPAGAEDPPLAWMADGTLLTCVNDTLYQWHSRQQTWKAFANLRNFGLHDVTRIAVPSKGDRIALVAPAK